MTVSTIDHCRVCHEPLEEVVAFGDQPLANGFNKPDVKYPLTFCRCLSCGLYQLAEVVDPDELFGDYVYRAGSGGMQQEMFHELATAAKHKGLKRGDTVVDIGGNDGSLLAEFKGCSRTNVDPYGVRSEHAALYLQAWGASMTPVKGARLILSTNSWAHINDIHDAVQGVVQVLDYDGYFIIQTPWIRDLLHNTLYDTIYHEHLSYWGVSQLRRLFQGHGMDVVHVDYLPKVHGGSIRCWISKDQSKLDGTVSYFQKMEELMPTPKQFGDMVERHQALLWDTLLETQWALYGCSAKAVMLVNLAAIGECLNQVVDDTDEKRGKTLPGTDLSIQGSHVLEFPRSILLGAWNYADAIKAKLGHGTIVTPFPVPIKEYL